MDDIVLDCRGLACPQPVLLTRQAVEKSPTALTVLVDDLAASENVRRFLEKSGYAPKVEQKTDSLWVIEGGLAGSEIELQPQPGPPPDTERILVFIASDAIGNGSAELGTRLMVNFLLTLPELGQNLWRIVMLNGGVKLASCPGPALDALKQLEASGVSILVCGTCLDHYDLLEQRQVGETTNMLDIISSLSFADKVIRP